jgi:hypothetical protein
MVIWIRPWRFWKPLKRTSVKDISTPQLDMSSRDKVPNSMCKLSTKLGKGP